MTVIKYTPGVSVPTDTPVAIVLGLFDGVHLGHRDLIKRTEKIAKNKGLTPAVFTFGEGTGIKTAAKRIYPESEKMRLFESLGIEIVFSADFGRVRDISAEDFIKDILVGALGATKILKSGTAVTVDGKRGLVFTGNANLDGDSGNTPA